MQILEMIDNYKALLDKKDELEAATKENNGKIAEIKDALAQAMIDEEMPKISRNGFMYSLQDKTKYSKKGDINDDDFFETLELNGLGDIIKRTVNASTLNSAMNNLAAENDDELPDDFKEYINEYQFYDITKRKETNKAAANAKKKKED